MVELSFDPRSLTVPLPAGPGAYALVIDVSEGFRLPIARLGKPVIAPGRYVYVGSARGPGGIRARLKRHLARDKKRHWHVDHLTTRFGAFSLTCYPGEAECRVVAELRRRVSVSVPITGFGSSDCRTCPSHLLRIDGP